VKGESSGRSERRCIPLDRLYRLSTTKKLLQVFSAERRDAFVPDLLFRKSPTGCAKARERAIFCAVWYARANWRPILSNYPGRRVFPNVIPASDSRRRHPLEQQRTSNLGVSHTSSTSHLSRLTSHLSRLTSHLSRLTSHLSRLSSAVSSIETFTGFKDLSDIGFGPGAQLIYFFDERTA
jgi:hypothetical protein